MLYNPLVEMQAAGNLRATRRRRNVVASKLRKSAER
jgi:hypothetical protein